jgi:hypothetical protein
MYGLAKNEDLKFLLSKRLDQISVGLFQILLNFENGVSISIECVFECTVDGKLIRGNNHPQSASLLFPFLGENIQAFSVESEGILKLEFSHGGVLTLYDSNPDSESYQINGTGKSIIV